MGNAEARERRPWRVGGAPCQSLPGRRSNRGSHLAPTANRLGFQLRVPLDWCSEGGRCSPAVCVQISLMVYREWREPQRLHRRVAWKYSPMSTQISRACGGGRRQRDACGERHGSSPIDSIAACSRLALAPLRIGRGHGSPRGAWRKRSAGRRCRMQSCRRRCWCRLPCRSAKSRPARRVL